MGRCGQSGSRWYSVRGRHRHGTGGGRVATLSSSFAYSTFLLKLHPSVSFALPPVGWHSTVLHEAQKTTVEAWEKTVVIWKQPGHLTSMKKELGD